MPQEMSFLSLVSKTLDTVIKSNVNAGVIASKESVAEEVWRQEKERQVEVHGLGVHREQWMDHVTAPDMVRDSGLAYRDMDNDGREV